MWFVCYGNYVEEICKTKVEAEWLVHTLHVEKATPFHRETIKKDVDQRRYSQMRG